MPFRFMHLAGFEKVLAEGRHRVFIEYADTYVSGWPDRASRVPGYISNFYFQGYTNGARWIGSAQGGASRVTTLGWFDAERNMMVKLHSGSIGLSLGAHDPDVNAPRGNLTGFSARRTFDMYRWHWTPELSVMQLSQGQDSRANKRTNTRLGVEVRMPL